MTTSEVFNFTEMPIVDNGMERYEEHEYEPISGTNLNGPGEIRINIEQQDLFTLPSKAYLLFEGQFVKADGTAYANTDSVTLTNNDNTSTAVLTDNQGFAIRQAYIIQKPTTKGTFSFCVPLSHIFGFCDDYDKVIYGLKHTTTLTRQSDNNAIFRLAAVAAGVVNLNEISLFMPNLIPADTEKFKLHGEIEKKVTIPVSFQMRQFDTTTVPQSTSFNWQLCVKTSPENTRYIIVGFQTSRTVDQTANASIFDHCDLKIMYIMLNNNERCPAVDYNLSFPN
ncbi:uncharacterized protein LOC136092112 [Hydra vulgaris]|uniref:Uncharacterized protein LOC136092112 n=1 Tax=Hydra vulgaris TaxID=6087 RepID=A0ABM4DMX9_HYDVU